MKKTFLLLAVMLMLGSSAFAIGGIDLSVGPKIGYQTAKLSYQKSDIKAGFANSFTLGLFGRVEFQGLYVQPEVLWFKSANMFDMNIDKAPPPTSSSLARHWYRNQSLWKAQNSLPLLKMLNLTPKASLGVSRWASVPTSSASRLTSTTTSAFPRSSVLASLKDWIPTGLMPVTLATLTKQSKTCSWSLSAISSCKKAKDRRQKAGEFSSAFFIIFVTY